MFCLWGSLMTRRYALIGTGKTGSQLPGLLDADEHVTQFNRSNPVTLEALKGHDAVICFVPGPVLMEMLPTLKASQLPVISGATGLSWPAELDSQLKADGVTWVWAHNFALGMNLVRQLLQVVGSASELLPQASLQLHEIHHTAKLDAPSGTALSWKDWLGQDVDVSYQRIGDVIGDHSLTITTPTEKITIQHQAQDRAIFATGALWACRYILNNTLPAGLIPFEQLTNISMQGNHNAN